MQQRLSKNAATFKIAACPLWAAVRKQLSFSTPQAASISMRTSTEDNCATPSADQPKRNTLRSALHTSFSTPQDATGVTVVSMSKGNDCTITSADQPTTRTTSRSVEQPSFPTAQQASAATELRPKSTGDNDCTSLVQAQSLLTERQQKMIVGAVSMGARSGQNYINYF